MAMHCAMMAYRVLPTACTVRWYANEKECIYYLPLGYQIKGAHSSCSQLNITRDEDQMRIWVEMDHFIFNVSRDRNV